MSAGGPQASVGPDVGPTIELDPQGRVANLDDIYLDGTLVLVGCGSAKRDPEDPVDLHVASVGPDEPLSDVQDITGPAWKAADLYTSAYFSCKREFAERVSGWVGDHDGLSGWAILSAEHKILHPWQDVRYYDKSIEDIGDDPTNPDHRVDNSFGRRRPDGQEIVTEMDQWAAGVAAGVARWTASYRDKGADPGDCEANTLLVLAGQDYINPLRERGVFEYGIARMAGNPNEGFKLPVRTRYLFEEIPAGGNGEQMGWLSDAVDRIDEVVDPGEQQTVGQWTGDDWACDICGAAPGEADVRAFDDMLCCEEHRSRQCARCDAWTHDNGLGGYPLCPDCQTERGGQKREPLHEGDGREQDSLIVGEEVGTGGDPA